MYALRTPNSNVNKWLDQTRVENNLVPANPWKHAIGQAKGVDCGIYRSLIGIYYYDCYDY